MKMNLGRCNRALHVPGLLLVGMLALFLPTVSHAEITVVFGTYAADKPTDTVRQYKPFLDFLEKELSAKLDEPVSIKMKISKTYEGGIDDLVTGDADFSRFGPASYVTAKERDPDISILAMESVEGAKTFKGIIAVHADSPIKSLSELRGKSFAFGSELSTIGRYLAQAQLLDAGISSKDLDHFEYLGRHDLVGTSVGNKNFTAGALQEKTFKKLVKKNVPIRALVMFDNVTKPWIASSSMDARVRTAMSEIMLDPMNLEQVRSVAKHGFLPGEDTDYEPIRVAMHRSEQF